MKVSVAYVQMNPDLMSRNRDDPPNESDNSYLLFFWLSKFKWPCPQRIKPSLQPSFPVLSLFNEKKPTIELRAKHFKLLFY